MTHSFAKLTAKISTIAAALVLFSVIVVFSSRRLYGIPNLLSSSDGTTVTTVISEIPFVVVTNKFPHCQVGVQGFSKSDRL